MPEEMVVMIISLFTPLVVYGATEFLKWLVPQIKGIWTLIVVPIISIAVTIVSMLAVEGSPHWYFQILIGLAAVFVNELKKAIVPPVNKTS